MPDDHTDDRRCRATAKRTGQRCKRSAIPGGTVCVKHGGGAPQVEAAAARRLRERAAILAVETFGLPREVDPHAALLEELHRTAGAVQWLGAIVADLEQDDVVWGVTKQKVGGDDEGTAHEAKPNAWYALWSAERKHLVDVAAACVKAGIEERRIQLAESQGQMLAGVIRRVLDRLGLTEDQRQLVTVVVPEELRAVTAPEQGRAS